MKVAVYTRVSTDKQHESLNNQALYFKDYLLKHPEYEPFSADYIYADEGLTGTKLNNRPAFNRLLYDAGIDVKNVYVDAKTKNGNIDKRVKRMQTVYALSDREKGFSLIILKNTSRFARNTLSFDIIDKLRNKGVHIYFLEQNINTKDAASDFQLKLYQIFDEQDSKDKSKKIKTGIETGHLKGTVRTNSSIYGYKYYPVPDNRLEIIPSEADTIRLIYKLYINENKGIRQIWNYLNGNKIYTRKNKPFSKSTIRRILQNEKYMGYNQYGKYDTGDVFNKKSYPTVNEDYAVEKSSKIPPIIKEETFQAAQKLLKSKVAYTNQKGVYKGTSKYNSKIFCDCCGAVYYSNRDRGRKFYVCSTKKRYGTEKCNNLNVNEKLVEETVQEYLGNSTYYVDAIKTYHIEYLHYIAYKLILDNPTNNATEIKALESEITEQENKLIGLYDLYSLAIDNKDILLNHIETINKSLTPKRERLVALKLNDEEKHNQILKVKEKIDYIENIPLKFLDTDDLLKYITIKIKQKEVNITLDIELDVSVFGEKLTDGYNNLKAYEYECVYNDYLYPNN